MCNHQAGSTVSLQCGWHDGVIKWKHFPRYWSVVRGSHWSQRPVTRCFDVFCHLRLNKRSNKQSRRRWFEMPSRSLWRRCNGDVIWIILCAEWVTMFNHAHDPYPSLAGFNFVMLSHQILKFCRIILSAWLVFISHTRVFSWYGLKFKCNSVEKLSLEYTVHMATVRP